ncbi:PGAP1-like protein [Marinobacterium mangrovicola]|uniref:PGAP1-like protein n=1 Tax=Marinobacterium mangrovicola TaxID=1476959 RepID=A0A4R1G800_9GAMM|nr:PGAP1-like protein [Marinobacterium mangrovicola]
MPAQPHIVLIHGLYMRPLVMRPMARWFEEQGYTTSSFGYRTTSEPLALNIEQLGAHLNAISATEIHLVCHSLGGLLARAYLESTGKNHPVTKVVTIGTPHQGAAIAQWMQINKLGVLLGQSLSKGLIDQRSDWGLDVPLGSIAGDGGVGFLPLIAQNSEPSDGTVAVRETHLEGETDHIVLPYSHTQLIMVTEVYQQALNFIQNGRFTR